MRRTALITLEYPPFKGGVGRFAHSIFHTLDKEKRYLVVPDSLAQIEDTCDRLHFFSKIIWPHWFGFLFSLKKYVKEKKIEHIIVFHVLPIGTVVYLCSLFVNIKYTISIHGLDFINAQTSIFKRILLRTILKKSENVIAISNFVKQSLIEFGVPEYKIALVSPEPFITPETIQSQRISNITETEVNRSFISVGRLVRRKNFSTLIEVARLAKMRHIPFQCIIVGDGPEQENLLKLIKEKDVSDHIRLLTDCSDQQLAWLYEHSYAGIFIPLSDKNDAEGYGIVCTEMSSYDKPVIASNQGGVPDAVQDKITGLLVDPNDTDQILHTIQVLHGMPALRKYLGKNGGEKYKYKNPLFKKTVQLLCGELPEPSISVVIPMFNAELFISKTIESLLSQTYKPKEIVIVDDGSTDNSLAVAKKYSKQCTIFSQANTGAPSARNFGFSKTTGSYVIFIDADITAKPEMLELMYKALLLNSASSWAYSSFSFGWKQFKSFPFSFEKLKKHNYIHTSSLIKKDSFPLFDQSLLRHQDWDLWLTLAEKRLEGIYIPKNLYTINLQKKRISSWIPSFVYSLPGANKIFPQVRKYEKAASIIRKKHNLL